MPSLGSRTQNLTRMAMLLALAIALGLAESLVLPALGVPGAKWGLANIISLVVLVGHGYRPALTILLLRVVLVSLVAGTFLGIGFWLSLGAGLASLSVMALLFKVRGFGLLGISISGAVSHNLVQLGIYALLIRSAGVFYLFPPLLLISLLTGSLTGIAVQKIRQYY